MIETEKQSGRSGYTSPSRRKARLTWLGPPGLLLALAACETVPEDEPPASSASMGMLIARDSCGTCHGLAGASDSPDEDVPTFGEIASRPGMTPEALATWLRDGHNYPAEMGFRLEPHQVDSLVAYMIRWRAGETPSES